MTSICDEKSPPLLTKEEKLLPMKIKREIKSSSDEDESKSTFPNQEIDGTSIKEELNSNSGSEESNAQGSSIALRRSSRLQKRSAPQSSRQLNSTDENSDNNDADFNINDEADVSPTLQRRTSRSSRRRKPQRRKVKKRAHSSNSNIDKSDLILLSNSTSFASCVHINNFKDQIFVDIRKFYCGNDESWQPTKKGIALTIRDWTRLKDAVSKIDESLNKKLESDS